MQNSLMIFFLIIVTIFTAGCILPIPEDGSNQNQENVTELNLTIIPEKTNLQEGEAFNINLTLTNIGNNSLNVWKMEKQISYGISFEPAVDNISAEWICGEGLAPAPDTGFLVELRPGESLNSTIDSHCWVLDAGEYILSAVYYTGYNAKGTDYTPSWKGFVNSNKVLIKVHGKPEEDSRYIRKIDFNKSSLRENEIFDNFDTVLVNTTAFMNAAETGNITITLRESTFNIQFEPREAETTFLKTYKGKVIGNEGSRALFTVASDVLIGSIDIDGKSYIMDQTNKKVNGSVVHIVYNSDDFKKQNESNLTYPTM